MKLSRSLLLIGLALILTVMAVPERAAGEQRNHYLELGAAVGQYISGVSQTFEEFLSNPGLIISGPVVIPGEPEPGLTVHDPDKEWVTEPLLPEVWTLSGNLLTLLTRADRVRQVIPLDLVRSGSAVTLGLGEQVQRQWTIRNDQGVDEVVDLQAWELTFTNGEPKFMLVLADGTKREYPVDNLYNEKDLRYLCGYILNKLEGTEELSAVAEDSESAGSGLSEHLKAMSERLNAIDDPVQLQVFFKYLTEELSLVSLGVVRIEAGTEPGQELILTICGEKWTFRWCPAGEFVMGSPVSERLRQMNEREHCVILTQGFWILDSEVTRQMYNRVKKEGLNNHSPSGLQQPATWVSWNDANDFCEWLQTIIGHEFTLPTEAQWEYACRAGLQNENTDDAAISEVAWFANNSSGYVVRNGRRYRTSSAGARAKHDVRGKKANAWGIYDMQGNVWEWCSDWYGNYGDSDATDPQGPERGQSRVMRGGSYASPAASCRPAFRGGQNPNQKSRDIGFRVILIPDAPEEADGNTSYEVPSAESADDGTISTHGFENAEGNAEKTAAAESNTDAGTAADNTDSEKE